MKIGILCSRGLGDILITLPLAKHYHDDGYEVVWPICEEFHGSVKDVVPWVTWEPITTDSRGDFFLVKPVEVFEKHGLSEDDVVNCYHYLNTMPELTDPELFNILKFDQYRYAINGVPFLKKWDLDKCIERNHQREVDLVNAIDLSTDQPYIVIHLSGSSVEISPTIVEKLPLAPNTRIINVEEYRTDCIFDWLSVLEGASMILCVDSAFANLVDQMKIEGPQLYWIRRSAWDATPVQGLHWTVVPTDLPITEPHRVNPALAAEAKAKQNS